VDSSVLLGDLMIVGGGVLWAATTLIVKTTALLKTPRKRASATQAALSIPILGLAA
jgi:drug/metabolite transporter (DMT)-like permease